MRCPKCGYISFDHMDTCLKCKKDISGGSEVAGTTYHAEAPSFLRFSRASEPVAEDDSELSLDEDSSESSFEFADPDLDVLSDATDDFVFTDADDEGGIALEESSVELAEDEFQLEPDEETVMDLDEAPAFAVPDELADISDLAPPSQDAETDTMELSLDEDLSADSSLDLDSFDLDLDLDLDLGDDVAKEVDVESLSLDDIDLSEEDLGTEDEDLDGLNMDLDLGSMDDDLETNKAKSSSSLDGLSLSLD